MSGLVRRRLSARRVERVVLVDGVWIPERRRVWRTRYALECHLAFLAILAASAYAAWEAWS